MTVTTKAQLITNFKAAEKRAKISSCGIAFLVEDRMVLNAQRQKLNLTTYQAARLVSGDDMALTAKNEQRFRVWDQQVSIGVIRMQPAPTGEHVGKVHVTKQFDDVTFDGRIKSLSDVQPAFNRAARQLIKVGVTNPHEAFKYMSTAFEVVKVEQKIDLKAERIVKELQMGDVTKDQVLATLDRVKQSF